MSTVTHHENPAQPHLWDGLLIRVRAFFAPANRLGKIKAVLEQDKETGEAQATFAAYEANKNKFVPILSVYDEDEPDYTDSITWHNPNHQPSS